MTHGSLFSGIGGFDLAAEWMGWENIFHCEINEFGRKVLKHYWPKAISYEDITKTDFTIHRGTIDVLSGGFPCQPFSNAGEKRGVSDERFLFPQMLRAISEIKPTWIVAENVNGITTPKFKNVLNEIYSSLEAESYQILPCVIPATAIGADHERYRIYFIAYSKRFRLESISEQQRKFDKIQGKRYTPNTLTSYSSVGRLFRQGSYRDIVRVNGISRKLDGITFSEWRKQSSKAAGNAIIPQVALQIFKAIEQYETIKIK